MSRVTALFVGIAALTVISTVAEAAQSCGRGWYLQRGRCVPQDDIGYRPHYRRYVDDDDIGYRRRHRRPGLSGTKGSAELSFGENIRLSSDLAKPLSKS
jgi:hypothetical protein